MNMDPACCCADFVDYNFAVTVKFEGKVDPASGATEEGFDSSRASIRLHITFIRMSWSKFRNMK